MGNLISFMKEVAEGLRKSGNYGTAHVYRSSMNAIIAFNGSRNLSFKKVNQEFLKNFETYLRGKKGFLCSKSKRAGRRAQELSWN